MVLISSNAFAHDDWTDADTKREAVFIAMDAIDWAQTRNIARNQNKWREQNDILGSHPRNGKVDAYFATTILAHAAIALVLPTEYRKAFQYITIGVEIGWIQHNYSIGIDAKF